MVLWIWKLNIKMRMFRLSCTCAKYHPVPRSPFKHSVVSSNSDSGQLRFWSDCADAQADLGLRCSHIQKTRFCMAWRIYSHGGHIGHRFRPRWLSWMRRPTRDQEVAGSTPAEVGNILSWRLMKYFLRSFSPFRWFKKGSCQFLAKKCAQYWLTA